MQGHLVQTNSNHRCTLKVIGEKLYVDSGGHQYQFQIIPIVDQKPQNSEEEVAVNVTLVDLIHDNHIIPAQTRIGA